MAFCSLFCLHPPFHHGSHPSSTVSSPCVPQLQLCSISRPSKYRPDRARYFRCGGFLPWFPHVTAYPCDIPLGSTLVVSGTEPETKMGKQPPIGTFLLVSNRGSMDHHNALVRVRVWIPPKLVCPTGTTEYKPVRTVALDGTQPYWYLRGDVSVHVYEQGGFTCTYDGNPGPTGTLDDPARHARLSPSVAARAPSRPWRHATCV